MDRDKNLMSLFEKSSKHDLRLSAKNVQFKSPSVTFMEHKLTDKGVEPDPAKVDAITKMLTPVDKATVQRFLGIRQYIMVLPQLVGNNSSTERLDERELRNPMVREP